MKRSGLVVAAGQALGRFKSSIATRVSPRGFNSFVAKLRKNTRLLDVGCGNNSPYKVKLVRPDIYYIGVDVADYNQAEKGWADEYILATPDLFVDEVRNFAGAMDAVVSSHNIEHCSDPKAVILAMAKALKPSSDLYLSFPCEQSVNFPSRIGCLNFGDDPTHLILPAFQSTVQLLTDNGCDILFCAKNYQPIVPRALGFLLEPLSKLLGRTLPGTWAFYGFESVIWMRKRT